MSTIKHLRANRRLQEQVDIAAEELKISNEKIQKLREELEWIQAETREAAIEARALRILEETK